MTDISIQTYIAHDKISSQLVNNDNVYISILPPTINIERYIIII